MNGNNKSALAKLVLNFNGAAQTAADETKKKEGKSKELLERESILMG